jgi:DNA polymerase
MNKAALLADLENKMMNCRQCSLGETRQKLVFGKGSPEAEIFFIGEGPGADEDKQGIPFVGRAGQLLDKIIAAAALPPESVYIANVVKCRPPGNRLPSAAETDTCKVYLREQLKIINPRIIVCLGAHAARLIFGADAKITQIRGKWLKKGRFMIMPTFHPAALLRDSSKKAPVWEDMKAVRDCYRRERL